MYQALFVEIFLFTCRSPILAFISSLTSEVECQQPSLNKLRGDRRKKKRNVCKEIAQDFTQMTPTQENANKLKPQQRQDKPEILPQGEIQSIPGWSNYANKLILIGSFILPRNIQKSSAKCSTQLVIHRSSNNFPGIPKPD